eukprot:TRINITY_DN3377_c0_g1_i1.p1 TRINITY_DN3377_c0_g1~~TRINITY_DN3377_c0_g1_i1.p1  ORF type:complete len:166 (+),score=17.41 TRINITY_DN3377_c0_g1_i1:136-633(+)
MLHLTQLAVFLIGLQNKCMTLIGILQQHSVPPTSSHFEAGKEEARRSALVTDWQGTPQSRFQKRDFCGEIGRHNLTHFAFYFSPTTPNSLFFMKNRIGQTQAFFKDRFQNTKIVIIKLINHHHLENEVVEPEAERKVFRRSGRGISKTFGLPFSHSGFLGPEDCH